MIFEPLEHYVLKLLNTVIEKLPLLDYVSSNLEVLESVVHSVLGCVCAIRK